MAVVAIPTTPGYRKATPIYIDIDVQQATPLGGAGTRIQRLGSRFALEVEFPPIKQGAALAALRADIIRGRRDGASYPFPQPGLTSTATGTPRVKGAGQSGNSLAVDGFATGASVKKGQFFAVIANGRSYLYFCTANANEISGEIGIPIWPMIRASPADNALVNFATPVIEGNIVDETFSFEHGVDDWVPGLKFRIEEVG